MKKIMICILLITSVLLVSCDRIERLTGHFNMISPSSFDNSTWRSENPDIWFTVDIIFEAGPVNFQPRPIVSKGEFRHNGEVYNINVRYMDDECIFVDAEINGEQVWIFNILGYSGNGEFYKGDFEANLDDPLNLNLDEEYETVTLVRVLK